MLSYVNRFNLALSKDDTEAIIGFFQVAPSFDQGADLSSEPSDLEIATDPEYVANLVMTGDTALRLAEAIYKVFGLETPSV